MTTPVQKYYSREGYDEDYYMGGGQYEEARQLQKVYSPCMDCPGIHQAFRVRTKYDQFWIDFYNRKAKSAPTNLVDLSFPH